MKTYLIGIIAGALLVPSAHSQGILILSAAGRSTPVAPSSVISMFGSNIALGTFTANAPGPWLLPNTLGGVSGSITDASGMTLPLSLVLVSADQVNAILPPLLATGLATVRLTSAFGQLLQGTIGVALIAPSLFTADGSGQWLAAAQVVTTHADGSQSVMNSIATCGIAREFNGYAYSNCDYVPVDIGSSTDQAVLSLYGTGLRNVNAEIAMYCNNCGVAPVKARTQDGSALQVLYEGAQGDGGLGCAPGMDQINILLPHSMAGAKLTTLYVEVATYSSGSWQWIPANPVSIYIQ